MSGIRFAVMGSNSKRFIRAWCLICFVVMISSETEGQQHQLQLQMQQQVMPTTIYNSHFMTERRLFCSNPVVRQIMFDCFATKGNPCALPPNLYEFYENNVEEQNMFKKYVATLCTDKNYEKDFEEFAKCMNSRKNEWSDCQIFEQTVLLNMTMKIFKNETVDAVCYPERQVIVDCYKTAGDKLCPNSSKTIFNNLALGTPTKLCTSKSNTAKSSITIVIFTTILAFMFVCFSTTRM